MSIRNDEVGRRWTRVSAVLALGLFVAVPSAIAWGCDSVARPSSSSLPSHLGSDVAIVASQMHQALSVTATAATTLGEGLGRVVHGMQLWAAGFVELVRLIGLVVISGVSAISALAFVVNDRRR